MSYLCCWCMIWTKHDSRSVSHLIFSVAEQSEKITQADWKFFSIILFPWEILRLEVSVLVKFWFCHLPKLPVQFFSACLWWRYSHSYRALKIVHNWMIAWVFLKNFGTSTWWEMWYLFKNTLFCTSRVFFFFLK